MEPVLDDGRLHGLQNADGQAVGPHHVHVGGAAEDLAEGMKLAATAIDTGRALEKLERLIALSREAL